MHGGVEVDGSLGDLFAEGSQLCVGGFSRVENLYHEDFETLDRTESGEWTKERSLLLSEQRAAEGTKEIAKGRR